jgi:hypothetical protein
MSRRLEVETLPSALRLLAPEATPVALEAPASEPAALADDADVTLGAVTGGGDTASVAGERSGTGVHTLTPPAGLPMSWSELDEWLEAS